MYSKIFSATAVALAASSLVSAQTFTACDPTKKDCPPDPALGGTVNIDFTKGKDESVLAPVAGTTIKYGNDGAVFTINKETDAPTMASHKYIFFGKLEVKMKASTGVGVVTSIVLQSDDLDEIDWEWLGGDNAQVQTNYFSKGDTSTYDRGAYHPVTSPITEYHTYTIDWTQESVKWLINGAVVRELTYAAAKGGSIFPQTPMQIKIGSWVAGRKDAPKGTVEWAGGYTDFTAAPFDAHYQSITITDYMGGKTAAKEYVYGDRSGTWQSIVVKNTGGDEEPISKSTSTLGPKTTDSSSAASQTTLATVTTTNSSGASTTSAVTTSASRPASQTTAAPGAGVMTKANLALGAVGLFFAFLL